MRPGLMRVVETSAWIEFLAGSALGASLASELPRPHAMVGPDHGAIWNWQNG
jgi:hypothetical protein